LRCSRLLNIFILIKNYRSNILLWMGWMDF